MQVSCAHQFKPSLHQKLLCSLTIKIGLQIHISVSSTQFCKVMPYRKKCRPDPYKSGSLPRFHRGYKQSIRHRRTAESASVYLYVYLLYTCIPVVPQGDIGRDMFIVSSGYVEVVGGIQPGSVRMTLPVGRVFGENSLLSKHCRRSVDVR